MGVIRVWKLGTEEKPASEIDLHDFGENLKDAYKQAEQKGYSDLITGVPISIWEVMDSGEFVRDILTIDAGETMRIERSADKRYRPFVGE